MFWKWQVNETNVNKQMKKVRKTPKQKLYSHSETHLGLTKNVVKNAPFCNFVILQMEHPVFL